MIRALDWVRRLVRRVGSVGGVFRRGAADERFGEEARFHLEQSAERHQRGGLSPEAARRAAAIDFGARQRFREEARDEIGGRRVAALANDIRYGVRSLRKTPAFSTAAILTLGLGIGATTLIFSITDHVVIRPLGYPESERLVLIREVVEQIRSTFPSISANASHVLEWQRRCTGCEQVGMLEAVRKTLSDRGEPVQLGGIRMSPEIFGMLGAATVRGRLFTAADDAPGAAPVVVLGYGFWRDRFGRDPGVIGSSIVLNGVAHEVVGVVDPGFRLPKGHELGVPLALPADPAFYAPLALTPQQRLSPGEYDYATIARRSRNRTVAELQSELTEIERSIAAQSQPPMGLEALVIPLQEHVVGTSRSTLLLLLGAVGAVLLIVCVNVANLMLARNAARRRESAVRVSLGAGRGRLVQQALVESLLLAIAGGGLGVALAAGGLGGLLRLAPADLPRLGEIRIDPRILAVSFIVTVGAGLLFGTVPALRQSRTDPADVLKSGSRTMTAGRAARRTRSVLVAAQVGLSAFLLVATGLIVSSFVRVLRVDRGFSADHVVALDLAVPVDRYPSGAARSALFDELLQRVEAAAGVSSAAIASALPLEGERQVDILAIEHDPKPELERPLGAITSVTAGYFNLLGIPIRKGRGFTPEDRGRRVVVLSERAARLLWPGQDPIGKRMTPGGNTSIAEVIGVAGDVKSSSLEHEGILTAYVPLEAMPLPEMSIVVRAAGDPAAVIGPVRAAVKAVAPTTPIGRVRTIAEVVSDALARRRFQVSILLLFALSAVATASVGIAGVISHSLAQRRNEIAVRLALGSSPGGVHRLVWREEMGPVAVGLGLGIAGSLAAAFGFRELLFQVHPADPVTLVAAAGTLGGVAAVACWLPARRATRAGSAAVLRGD